MEFTLIFELVVPFLTPKDLLSLSIVTSLYRHILKRMVVIKSCCSKFEELISMNELLGIHYHIIGSIVPDNYLLPIKDLIKGVSLYTPLPNLDEFKNIKFIGIKCGKGSIVSLDNPWVEEIEVDGVTLMYRCPLLTKIYQGGNNTYIHDRPGGTVLINCTGGKRVLVKRKIWEEY